MVYLYGGIVCIELIGEMKTSHTHITWMNSTKISQTQKTYVCIYVCKRGKSKLCHLGIHT